MPDYSNSIIYRIFNSKNGLSYIGSTTQKLSHRATQHRYQNKSEELTKTRSIKVYEGANKDDIFYQVLEKVCCNNRKELEIIERKYIESMDCVNYKIPNRTPKEYYEANKMEIRKKALEFYYKNKDSILKRKKENYKEWKEKYMKQITCECGIPTSPNHIKRHRESKRHKRRMEHIDELDFLE